MIVIAKSEVINIPTIRIVEKLLICNFLYIQECKIQTNKFSSNSKPIVNDIWYVILLLLLNFI
jgi:hypothetical protein